MHVQGTPWQKQQILDLDPFSVCPTHGLGCTNQDFCLDPRSEAGEDHWAGPHGSFFLLIPPWSHAESMCLKVYWAHDAPGQGLEGYAVPFRFCVNPGTYHCPRNEHTSWAVWSHLPRSHSRAQWGLAFASSRQEYSCGATYPWKVWCLPNRKHSMHVYIKLFPSYEHVIEMESWGCRKHLNRDRRE